MTRGGPAHFTLDDRIEQALAFGRSRAWICDRLGVTSDYIDEVIQRQNAACTADAPGGVMG